VEGQSYCDELGNRLCGELGEDTEPFELGTVVGTSALKQGFCLFLQLLEIRASG